jgi:hypothetical protein
MRASASATRWCDPSRRRTRTVLARSVDALVRPVARPLVFELRWRPALAALAALLAAVVSMTVGDGGWLPKNSTSSKSDTSKRTRPGLARRSGLPLLPSAVQSTSPTRTAMRAQPRSVRATALRGRLGARRFHATARGATRRPRVATAVLKSCAMVSPPPDVKGGSSFRRLVRRRDVPPSRARAVATLPRAVGSSATSSCHSTFVRTRRRTSSWPSPPATGDEGRRAGRQRSLTAPPARIVRQGQDGCAGPAR